jgi:hypothetical protein
MRSIPRTGWILTVTLTVASVSLWAGDAGKPLQADDEVPGNFQVLMVTGPRAGKFHCPVCEFDLNPGILVFIRELEDVSKPAVASLLKKLDAVITKHPLARLGGCAIVLDDGGYRQVLVAKLDDTSKVADLELTKVTAAKEEKEARLSGFAKKEELKNLTLALGSKGGPEKYKLNPNADVTALIYNKLKIVGSYAFTKGELADKDVDKIVNQFDATAVDVVKALRRKK